MMDPKTAYKLYLRFLDCVKRVNKGEIVFSLEDGRKVVLAFSVEEEKPKLYICHDKDGMKENETA